MNASCPGGSRRVPPPAASGARRLQRTTFSALGAWLLCALLAGCAARAGEQDAAFAGSDWGEAGPSATDGGGGAARRPSTVWSIVLATFSSPQHAEAAANMVSQLPGVFPQLAGAWTHSDEDGSLVLYGRYERPQSDQAQRDLKMVKSISHFDAAAFPRAMLTRVDLRSSPAEFRPYELMSVRQRYPGVDPLYTLEVAAWGDFGSGRLTVAEVQRRAEEYCRRLRAEGYQAYFHHDDDKRMSMVTVGVFGRNAIDPRTGLYGPEVEALLERFPHHLVNGEPLLEPIDGRDPARGTQVQRPRLVQVPAR